MGRELVLAGLTRTEELHRLGVELVVLGLIVAVVVIRVRVRSGPFGLPRRIPRRLSAPPRLTWVERPFMGWGRSWLGRTRFALGRETDALGVIGPHSSGKTFGVLIPQALLWGGPLISTSTKPDVLRATAGRRLELASEHGGRVHVYAPTSAADDLVEGLRPLRWSPLAGCTDPRIATLRVETLLRASQTGRGIENADHWRAGASRILRAYFLAAAHHAVRPGNLLVVRNWLAAREFDEPLSILDGFRSFAGDQWAAELRGVAATPQREQGSFFTAAEGSLAATADPNVLRSAMGTDLDPVEFLRTRSTLYIVSPSEHQAAVAPLISALIESIVVAAYDLFREGGLDRRLLLSLDELANIAPLPSLGAVASQGSSQGVNLSWAAQSLAQLRDRYGVHAADAIWSEATGKVVFGGLSDGTTLQGLSAVIGEHRVQMRSRSRSWSEAYRSTSETYRPRVPPAALAQLPRRWVLLLHGQGQAYALRAPIAPRRRVFRRGLLPWPAPAAPRVAVAEPAREE
jgi:type IV secretion system protein VirD4